MDQAAQRGRDRLNAVCQGLATSGRENYERVSAVVLDQVGTAPALDEFAGFFTTLRDVPYEQITQAVNEAMLEQPTHVKQFVSLVSGALDRIRTAQ